VALAAAEDEIAQNEQQMGSAPTAVGGQLFPRSDAWACEEYSGDDRWGGA
jgi:hypothetical protein